MSRTRGIANFLLLACSLALPSTFTAGAQAEPGDLYQQHGPQGFLYKYTGTPCSDAGCPGWKMIDGNLKLKSVTAAGGSVYGIAFDAGSNSNLIWQYTDQPSGCSTVDTCPGWTSIDANNATHEIFAGGGKLYQRHNNGSIYEFTGAPCGPSGCPGWKFLFKSPIPVDLAVANGTFYELNKRTHEIFRRNGEERQLVGNNPGTRRIYASGQNLYTVAYNGLIWMHTGQPCQGEDCSAAWRALEGPSGEVENVRPGRNPQLNDTRVIYFVSFGRIQIAGLQQMIGGAAQALDIDPNLKLIAAGGSKLYKQLNDGKIYVHDDRQPIGCGEPSECQREWTLIDSNSYTDGIFAED